MNKYKELQAVKGTFDILPEEFYIYESICNKIKDCFESFGYKRIELPIVEYADLHLRKSGEEIISKMYVFKDYGNRTVCLRPELTASVVRAFINNLRNKPLPIRLYYIGPVFRYDKPQYGRYRQFTHVGIELIGSDSPLADAEIISMACKALKTLGLSNYRVVIGHIGFVLNLLDNLEVDERVKNFFIQSMEELSKEKGISYIKNRLKDLDIAQESQDNENNEFIPILQNMEYTKAKSLIYGLLQEINASLNKSRIPQEIAERLLLKIKRKNQRKNVDKAIEFIEKLSQIKGIPPKIFVDLEELINEYKLDNSPLVELKKVMNTLEYFDINWQKVSIDLGFGRGLQYYTGIIFEIYYDKLGSENQICGGGRYDELVRIIGGKRDIPALGFAYGLERVKLALEMEKKLEIPLKGPDIFIIPIGRMVDGYAIRLAETLRSKELKVEMDVKERKLSRNLEYADENKIPFVILIGEEEKNSSTFKLKDMHTKVEKKIPLSNIDEVVRIVKKDEIFNHNFTK